MVKHIINGVQYEENSYGMWRQLDPKPFDYDTEYLNKQSTNEAMCWLRCGFLASAISPHVLKNMTAVELGPGRGVFFDHFAKFVKRLEGYDVSESKYKTINKEELVSISWDLLLAYDVLEHFEDINDLWDIKFRWGVFSLPRRPERVDKNWRHLKPDEHIWHINEKEFASWANDNGYEVMAFSHVEDLIRKSCSPNIMSFVIRRKDV